MALSGSIREAYENYPSSSGNSGGGGGNSGGYTPSDSSSSGGLSNSIYLKNGPTPALDVKQNITQTAPLSEYNPFTDKVPQSVIDAENELNLKSIPNQEYANQVQSDIINDYHGYLLDKNYQGKYSATQAIQGYEYLSRANSNISDTDWVAPKADDQLFTEIVPQWDAAKNIYASATKQNSAPLTSEESIRQSVYGRADATQREVMDAEKIEHGDWRTLSLWDKAKALFVPSSNIEDTMENAPDWAKYIQNIIPSTLAGSAGAALGGALVGGPVGALVGFGTVAGLSYLQGVTGVKIPVINEMLYGMDVLSVWAEQGQGAIGATAKKAWDRAMEDGHTDLLELGKEVGGLLSDFPDLFEVSQVAYEVGADLGFDNLFNTVRNAGAWVADNTLGTEFGQNSTNNVSRANLGLGGIVEVNSDTRGYDSLTDVYLPLYRSLRDEAINQGMEKKEAKEFAMNSISDYLVNYMGTTGLINDFGASALFDPMNLAPYVQAKTADAIATRTGDTALHRAATVALDGASPIVDMFSVPGLEQIAEFITGKHGTQGMDTIRRVYAQELQQHTPVEKLNSLQRRIAGVDNNGLIKNYDSETNPVKRFFGQTDEAKMFSMSENLVSFIGSFLFSNDTDPALIPEIMSQIAGISPITDDSPLAQYKDSALLKTFQSALGDVNIQDINDIQKKVNSYRQLNPNRAMVNEVASKLHMTVDQVFDALDDTQKSIDLHTKMLQNNITFQDGSGLVFDPSQVFDKISVFGKDQIGRGQYSVTTLKADAMDTFTRKADSALLKRYNIEPDGWFARLGNLEKSVQSVALLNFSPSYFINNFLNNILTRSVVGVGGFDTDIVQTANAKRGLFFSRETPEYEQTGKVINSQKTKNDLIGRAQQAWNNLTDDKKPIGKILKGFGNFGDIESIETKSAFEIGANRYWESTWKPGLNIPNIPPELVSLGFTPEMNDTIYKVAMDSANLNEFKQKLMGEVILPGARSTLADTISKNYSETYGNLMKNMIDSNPWIIQRVSDLLETGNPEVISKGFDEIIRQVTSNVDLQNVVQLESTLKDVTNRVAAEGISAVGDIREALDALYTDIWIEQTKLNEEYFHQRAINGLIDSNEVYESHINNITKDYNMVRKYEIQMLAGMIAGLGLNDDISKQLVINTLQQFDIESKYIFEEHELYKKYAVADSPDYDYAYYAQSKLEMLKKVQDMKLQASKEYDALIVQYLRDNLDKSYTNQIDDYESRLKDIERKKENLNAKELQWAKERLDIGDIVEKERVAREDQNTRRIILKSDIQAWQHDANVVLQELQGGIDKNKSGKVQLSLEQTLALELLIKESEKTVANSGDFLEHYIDKSEPKTVFEPANFKNTNINESFVEYSKKNYDAATLAEMQSRYANGDAVPLGSVDVRGTENMVGKIGENYPAPDFMNPDESIAPDIAIDIEPVNTESVQNIREIIDELNDSIDLKEATKEAKTIVNDANFYRNVIDEKTGDYVQNYQFYDEARKSILSDIKDKKPIKDIVANAEKEVIETAKRKMYGMLDQELKKSPDSAFGLTKEELKNVIEYQLDTISSSLDHDLGNSKDVSYDTDVRNSIDVMTEDGKRYLESITNKAHKQLDRLQYFLNNFKENLYGDNADVASPDNISNTSNVADVVNPDVANTETNNTVPVSDNADTNTPKETVENIGTGFQPFKPDFDKSEAKYSQVATNPFYFGEHLVKAGVYEDGKLIAYITSDMPDTIEVNGYTFPVIGFDIEDPNSVWIYIEDESMEITPGKLNSIEFSVYAENGEHPMRYGTTPTTEPWGTAAWETSLPLREALNLWRDESLDALHKATQNGSFFGKLTAEQQDALYKWADTKLNSAFNYQRFASQRYGNTMVDLSLLNYQDTRGFDTALTSIMPYQYWLTRSMMNWGARMIDQPKWFSMYSRLNKLIEKNKRDFLPTRLEGMPAIPMPFMPEGQGQGIYYNPYDVLLPHKQFLDVNEYFERNMHTIHKNTISTIEEYFRANKPYEGHVITEEEYEQAMLGKGSLYAKVFWDQRNSDETSTGLSGLVGSLINPNVLVTAVTKALEGKNKEISYSPMYKLGNTLRSAAHETMAQNVFNFMADALQLPETQLRKLLGAESDPIGSNWADYWTVKYLTDMLYTKERSNNEIMNAIAEGDSNPLWQEARQRYSQSQAYAQQGGMLLNEVMQSMAGNKKTSVGQLAGSALVSLFGGKTYSSGEEDYRRMQDLYQKIKDDPGMYEEFWKQLPQYKAGSYARIDDRNELLHTILVDNCNAAFYALPETEQKAVIEALNSQHFNELFLDPKTRATDQIDNATLIEWTRAMQGNVPNISDKTINGPMQDALKIQWYSDSLNGLYDRYMAEKKQKFPGIDAIEQGYFNAPFQDQYKAMHPELQQYWDWKEEVSMSYPELGTYLNRTSALNSVKKGKYQDITDAVISKVNNYTKKCLENYQKQGWKLPPKAEHQLKITYTNLGINIPFETWVKEIRFAE